VVKQKGFTYLGVLIAVALMTPSLAIFAEVWRTSLQREKERELLHVGNAYRRAIMLYYEGSPGGLRRYPRQLEDLVKDNRYPATRRYLRRLYPDPISGTAQWGLVRAPDGGIMGVFSPATDAPLKTGNFRLLDAGFSGAGSYAAWKFVYVAAPPVVAPWAAGAATPPAR
jgi:type II secretory pathway pseudopilin PulG